MCRVALGLALAVSFCGAAVLCAGEKAAAQKSAAPSVSAQLEQAKRRATSQTYELRYQFKEGETLQWTVTHLVTVLTKIQGSEQTAKTRSVSTKQWKVAEVDADGNAKLVHSVESVDMWQQISGRQEVRYNSETDKTPPLEYEQVAKSVGQPLTSFNVNRHGVLLNRHDERSQYNPGLGQLIISFPAQAVKIGDSWSLPQDVAVRLEGGEVKQIKTRERYVLESVEAGVATIKVQTQVLTPVNDPKVEAQLVQRLTKGTLKFDLDAGRLISKQIDLDETVVGFSGADSLMQYLARFTEETAEKKAESAASETDSKAATLSPALESPTEEAAAKPDVNAVLGDVERALSR